MMTEDEKQELNDLRAEWFVLQGDEAEAYKALEKRHSRLQNKLWRLFKKIDEKT